MNHNRRRPKHQRAGCLMCKPWKDDRGHTYGGAHEKPSVRRETQVSPAEALHEYDFDISLGYWYQNDGED